MPGGRRVVQKEFAVDTEKTYRNKIGRVTGIEHVCSCIPAERIAVPPEGVTIGTNSGSLQHEPAGRIGGLGFTRTERGHKNTSKRQERFVVPDDAVVVSTGGQYAGGADRAEEQG